MIIPFVALALAVIAHSTRYDVVVQTSSKRGAETDNIGLYLTLYGSGTSFDLGELDDPKRNDFERGRRDHFSSYGRDIGDIECIKLYARKDDRWLFDWISVQSIGHKKQTFHNTASVWLSSDKSEGRDSMKLCTKDRKITYSIDVKTASLRHAGTDNIKLFLTVLGSDGNVNLGELDNHGINDLEKGSVDTFHKNGFRSVGTIKCITLQVYRDDAWLFDWIDVKSGNYNKKFHNRRHIWLSSDSSEGSRRLTLCA